MRYRRSKKRAVIDRFEEEWAVLLVGTKARVLNVLRTALPTAATEGQWLLIETRGDELISAVLDQEETKAVQARIEEKLERLRRGEHLK